MKIFVSLFILSLFSNFGFAQDPVENISWDKKTFLLILFQKIRWLKYAQAHPVARCITHW
jgi:hypothetical protein